MGTFQDIAPRPSRNRTMASRPLSHLKLQPRPATKPITPRRPQPAQQAQQTPHIPRQEIPKKPPASVKSYAATVALAVSLGLLAQFQVLGVLIILVYTVASIIWRIPSRKTFLLALLSVGATAAALLINRWVAAKNFAAYSFLLMAAGTLSLCIEQGRLSHLLHKKHQTLQTEAHGANVKRPY